MDGPLSDFDFELPEELVAQDPAERRGDSRMLLVEPGAGVAGERTFRDLPSLLQPGDLLILNQSRVLPARLYTRRSDTGGRVEILLVQPAAAPNAWLAMARPARRLKPGTQLEMVADAATRLEVLEKRDDGMVVIRSDRDPAQIAEEWGTIPLPPYIRRDEDPGSDPERAQRDRRRYQTVFAQPDESGAGSVAAPTAGLHFSDRTLSALAERGVVTKRLTLHVGPGTFQPPSPEQLASGRLHRESFHLPADVMKALETTPAAGGRIIAVGTTSLRVLETVARLDLSKAAADEIEFPVDNRDNDPLFRGRAIRKDGGWDVAGETRLFIRPPEKIQAVDGLLTNFHLPGSSLLMLVASLTGPGIWAPVYEHAVRQRMRFYSYGDCMLILPGFKESEI